MYTTHDPAFVSVSRFDDIHTVAVVRGEKQHTTVHSSSLAELKKKKHFAEHAVVELMNLFERNWNTSVKGSKTKVSLRTGSY